MTAVEVARELGVNERTVRRAIASGRLPARKVHSRAFEINLAQARHVIRGSHQAALAEALETLREIGYGADADEIVERYGL